MALAHQLLYERKDFSRIDLGDYLQRLVQSIRATGGRVTLQLVLPDESVHLEQERAIPCGLLVNELVTNSFKHAFLGERRGEIAIELNEDIGQICFRVVEDYVTSRASRAGTAVVRGL